MKEDMLKNVQDKIAIEKFKKTEKRKIKLESVFQNTFMFLVGSLSITGIVFATDISTWSATDVLTTSAIKNFLSIFFRSCHIQLGKSTPRNG